MSNAGAGQLTHTHSGPSTSFMEGWGQTEPSYVERIPVALCGGGGRGPSPHSTRFKSAPRRARFGRWASIGCGATGRSTAICMSCVSTASRGHPKAVLFSHGCHPVTIDRRTDAGPAISATGRGRSRAACNEEGYGEALFRLGVCGDIDPVVAWHQFAFEGMELSAEARDAVVPGGVCARSPPRPSLRIRLARRDVPLPLEPLSEEDIAAGLAEAQTGYGSIRVSDSGVDNSAWLRFYGAWAEAMHARIRARSRSTSPSALPRYWSTMMCGCISPARSLLRSGKRSWRVAVCQDRCHHPVWPLHWLSPRS